MARRARPGRRGWRSSMPRQATAGQPHPRQHAKGDIGNRVITWIRRGLRAFATATCRPARHTRSDNLQSRCRHCRHAPKFLNVSVSTLSSPRCHRHAFAAVRPGLPVPVADADSTSGYSGLGCTSDRFAGRPMLPTDESTSPSLCL